MFDFDKLSQLSNDPVAFEKARWEIIKTYLESLPEQQRMAGLALQYQLDMKRETMTNQEFMAYCFQQISVNLHRMETSAKRLLDIIDGTTVENVAYIDDFRAGRRIQDSSKVLK